MGIFLGTKKLRKKKKKENKIKNNPPKKLMNLISRYFEINETIILQSFCTDCDAFILIIFPVIQIL